MRMFVVGNGGAVVTVVGHHLQDVFVGTLEFFGGVDFAQLQLRDTDNLVGTGPAGIAFRRNRPDEVIVDGCEGEDDLVVRGFLSENLHIGEEAGIEQNLEALTHQLAIKRLASFLWQQLDQMLLFPGRDAHHPDVADRQSQVLGDWAKSRVGRLRQRFSRRGRGLLRKCRRSGRNCGRRLLSAGGRGKQRHDQNGVQPCCCSQNRSGSLGHCLNEWGGTIWAAPLHPPGNPGGRIKMQRRDL